ncbi:MAG: thymidylate synthase [Lysobacter sp.]|nr:thymidylate synthase [Lysobacter sp.]
MNYIIANSANEMQISLCQQLLESGTEASPRGLETREVLGFAFEIKNPRNRLTSLKARKWSPSLAAAELAWHLRGDTDVEALAFYTPRWRDFADTDGQVRGSCYGARIFEPLAGKGSQWNNVRNLLNSDHQSRRAVLNFRIEEDVSRPTKDLSCTNTLQFIIRDRKLHAFTNMRSNDAIWGVPYDVFLFTILQEMMALELGTELGSYHHYASSMHVYKRHYELAIRVASAAAYDTGEMPAMTSTDGLYAMANEESSLRLTGKRSRKPLGAFEEYCLDLLGKHENLSAA